MHTCWSPVPRCRPGFQQLVRQLEGLTLKLNPASLLKEPLHYVNLEGDAGERAQGSTAHLSGEEATGGVSNWSVPWKHRSEGEEKDWLMVGSGAALAIGGDYRYILSPHGAPEEEDEQGSGAGRRDQEMRDEDDVIINV